MLHQHMARRRVKKSVVRTIGYDSLATPTELVRARCRGAAGAGMEMSIMNTWACQHFISKACFLYSVRASLRPRPCPPAGRQKAARRLGGETGQVAGPPGARWPRSQEGAPWRRLARPDVMTGQRGRASAGGRGAACADEVELRNSARRHFKKIRL